MKYTVTFLVVRQRDNNTDGRLRCRVSFNKKRVEFNMGYHINFDGWNADTQRCKRNSMHGRHAAQKINAEIEKADTRIAEIMEADDITPDRLRALFRENIEPDVPKLTDIINRFITAESLRWAEGTVKKFHTLKSHIESQDVDVSICEVSTEWMARFSRQLTETLCNASVNKEMKNVRWFLRWAYARGYDVDKDACEWAPKLKTSPRRVIYLEWDELMSVYTHHFHNLHHAEVRDCLCFCCFTGLRFSDVRALKRSDIHGDMMSVTTIKTGELVDIPLNKYARAILDTYKDEKRLGNRALPVCNNAEMNEAVKEVAKACELNSEVTLTTYKGNKRVDTTYKKWEVITTHCGRRTFVCNALMMGTSAEVVMSITGHSDYSSMKPYIAVAGIAKKEAMRLFDEKNVAPKG